MTYRERVQAAYELCLGSAIFAIKDDITVREFFDQSSQFPLSDEQLDLVAKIVELIHRTDVVVPSS